jgi:hypothetical protein
LGDRLYARKIVLGGSIVLYLLVDPHVRFWHQADMVSAT